MLGHPGRLLSPGGGGLGPGDGHLPRRDRADGGGDVGGQRAVFPGPGNGGGAGTTPRPPYTKDCSRAALQVTYFDKDGAVLLTWDGPVELW